MDLIKDDVRKLFYNFLIPAISSAVAVAAYSLVDTIAIGQGVGPDGTAACALVLPIFSIANFLNIVAIYTFRLQFVASDFKDLKFLLPDLPVDFRNPPSGIFRAHPIPIIITSNKPQQSLLVTM